MTIPENNTSILTPQCRAGAKDNPVLLAVLAHPDDESFGLGGTLALYARSGVDVHLVCATRGESGDVKPEHLKNFNSITERRMHELSCAADVLGLAGVHFLDYRDSGMSGSPDNDHPQSLVSAPVDEVAAHMSDFIRQLRPEVVLTFDPIGGYKHPDHIAVHNATVKAFKLAADPQFNSEYYPELPPFLPAKLYFHVFPKNFLRFAVWMLKFLGRDPRHFGRNNDVDLLSLVEEGSFPVHARINYGQVKEFKEQAALCHKSQLDGDVPRRGPISWILRYLDRQDLYMRYYPPPESRKIERDLFAGI
jgi:N-acetyl-1-D-myo-inositol-2-amino-2-deoxy-alpha-D-glucopyranoside deacetylase